jgi:hypothetical protein
MTAWHASSGGSGPRPGYLRGSGQGHRRREQGPGAPRLELAHYVRAARHVVVSVRGRSERAERCPEGGGQAEAAGDDGGGPARDGQLAGGGPDSYDRGISRRAGEARLGFACRVSPSGQLMSRREEALLQVCVRMFPRARWAGCAIVAFRLFCRPG